MHERGRANSLRAAGILLGFGLGGFVDGILAHQLLEWHHMLSGWYPPVDERNLRLNMMGDGLFHLACLLIVLIGIAMLVRVRPDAASGGSRCLAGWMLVGWGVFNLLEGLIDHQILGVHHVRPGPHQLAYDLGFLAFGVLLVIGGTLTIPHRGRSGSRINPS